MDDGRGRGLLAMRDSRRTVGQLDRFCGDLIAEVVMLDERVMELQARLVDGVPCARLGRARSRRTMQEMAA